VVDIYLKIDNYVKEHKYQERRDRIFW